MVMMSFLYDIACHLVPSWLASVSSAFAFGRSRADASTNKAVVAPRASHRPGTAHFPGPGGGGATSSSSSGKEEEEDFFFSTTPVVIVVIVNVNVNVTYYYGTENSINSTESNHGKHGLSVLSQSDTRFLRERKSPWAWVREKDGTRRRHLLQGEPPSFYFFLGRRIFIFIEKSFQVFVMNVRT